jgi:hypothetical protein
MSEMSEMSEMSGRGIAGNGTGSVRSEGLFPLMENRGEAGDKGRSETGANIRLFSYGRFAAADSRHVVEASQGVT